MATTMAEISAAINEIDIKKQNLHKSFMHLQSQLPSSFNLPFNWSDLDSYFTTLQSSLQSKFNNLQTVHPPPDPIKVPARPELKLFCENSDGLGLNRFIAFAQNQQSILSELPDAYRCSLDAPAMVLDAMVVFYDTDKGTELGLLRSGCLIMLEGLLRMNPDITIDLKNKAMEIAVQWNRNRVSGNGKDESLGFVLLVGAYGLIERFSIDDIIDCFLVIATDDKTIDLCRRIIPENNIKDMIKNLMYKDMHVTAVKFIIQLQKTDEFSLVDLLKERKLRSMRNLEKKRKNAKYRDVWKGAIIIELKTLKSIIKCMGENQIESKDLKDSVIELVNKLENELENSQNVNKQSNKSKKQKLNESQPTVDSSPVQNVESIQESRSQKSNLSPDNVNDQVVEIPNEVEDSKQISEDESGLRKQPVRATVLKRQQQLKSKMLNKSKVNAVERTTECALATPVQNDMLIQESRSQSQKSDMSPDHVECDDSPSANNNVVELENEIKIKNDIENNKQTPVDNLVLRKQPPRAAVLKSQLVSKSKICKYSNKPKVNIVQPTVDSAAVTPVQSVKSAQESNSQKSYLSPDHGGSAVGSDPHGSNAPNASVIASRNGSIGGDIGYNCFVQQFHPLPGNHSNGWITE